MSIALMTIVWKIPFPTSTQMLLALKLADHAKDDGTDVFPGKSSLADRARCSISTVKTTLRLLRESGILIVVREGGQKGPHDTTEYRFNVGLLEALARGDVAISGSSAELILASQNEGEETGSKIDPIRFDRVANNPVPGRLAAATRSAHNPQTINNHKEPSRAGALATQSAARPSLEVKAGETSWPAWLEVIEAKLGEEARQAATRLGRINVMARWPRDGVPLPSICDVEGQI
jgi:hypothetical protein